MGDEVYQPDGSEVQDDEGLLEPEDTLDARGPAEVLDEGYSPPERPWAVESWGTTAEEQHRRESLEGRLAREVPEKDASDSDGLGDASDTDGELLDEEVGDERAGRLTRPDRGMSGPQETDLFASDVGIDGAAASAEEAAVHLVPEEESGDQPR
jgi:hypothetical protein